MTRDEFKNFVLSEAKKVMSEKPAAQKVVEPKIQLSDINEMVDEFKKMTSRLDLRSPMMEASNLDKERLKKLYTFERPSDDDR